MIYNTFYAVLQGITELLPISSSGHLLMLERVFSAREIDVRKEVFVHIGSAVAIFFLLLNSKKEKKIREFYTKKNLLLCLCICIISSMPILFMYLLYSIFNIPVWSYFLQIRENIFIFLLINLIFAIPFLFTWQWGLNKKDILIKNAFVLGIVQSAAFMPGASRSGVILTTAWMLGYTKESSLALTLLTGIFMIFILSPYTLLKPLLSSSDIFETSLIYMSIISFLTTVASYKLLQYIISCRFFSLKIIGVYRVLLSIVGILLLPSCVFSCV